MVQTGVPKNLSGGVTKRFRRAKYHLRSCHAIEFGLEKIESDTDLREFLKEFQCDPASNAQQRYFLQWLCEKQGAGVAIFAGEFKVGSRHR